jgi:hypothetical protein
VHARAFDDETVELVEPEPEPAPSGGETAYAFDGYRIELSEKVMLTTVAPR